MTCSSLCAAHRRSEALTALPCLHLLGLQEFLDALKVHLSEGKDVRANMWKAAEVSCMCSVPGLAACGVTHKMLAAVHAWQVELLNQFNFLTAKPMIYLVNLSKKHYIKKKNNWYVKGQQSVFWVAVSWAPHFSLHASLHQAGGHLEVRQGAL